MFGPLQDLDISSTKQSSPEGSFTKVLQFDLSLKLHLLVELELEASGVLAGVVVVEGSDRAVLVGQGVFFSLWAAPVIVDCTSILSIGLTGSC